MAWIDLIDERRARRLTRPLLQNIRNSGALAQDYGEHFVQQAGRALAEQRRQLERPARDISHDLSQTAHELAELGRHEAALLAHEAGRQVHMAGRMIRRDPLPFAFALIGIAALASLTFSARARRR